MALRKQNAFRGPTSAVFEAATKLAAELDALGQAQSTEVCSERGSDSNRYP